MEFTVGSALSEGWRVMKNHYGSLLGAAWMYILISAAMQLIPILGPLASLVVTGPLVAGWAFMGVLAYRGEVRFGNMFDGFGKFGKMLGIYWLTFLISLGLVVPAGIGAGIAFAVDQDFEGVGIPIVVVGCLVTVVLMFFVLTRLVFAMMVGMDSDLGVTASMGRSWQVTKPYLGRLILLYVCIVLISIPLVLLLYLPLVFLGMPWFVSAGGATYCMINQRHDTGELERIYE